MLSTVFNTTRACRLLLTRSRGGAVRSAGARLAWQVAGRRRPDPYHGVRLPAEIIVHSAAGRGRATNGHVDEVFLRIGGKQDYLWRAVDQQGAVPDILAPSRRNAKATRWLFKKLLKGLQHLPPCDRDR